MSSYMIKGHKRGILFLAVNTQQLHTTLEDGNQCNRRVQDNVYITYVNTMFEYRSCWNPGRLEISKCQSHDLVYQAPGSGDVETSSFEPEKPLVN